MKRITALILSALLLCTLLVTGCGKAVKDEVVTIYNRTNVKVNIIAMAPEADVLNSENVIIFCDAPAALDVMSAEDYFTEIPEELLNSDWYLYVSGTSDRQEDPYILEKNVGAVFENDHTYGFQFIFDYDVENLDIVPLSGV